MGRFDEALETHQEALELDSRSRAAAINLAQAARVVGRHSLADSALAIAREITGLPYLRHEAANAYYAGDLALADSLADEPRGGGYDPIPLIRAGLSSIHGRMGEALALVDSAELGFIVHVSLAADAPERALTYLERSRTEPTPGAAPRRQYESLGVIAYGYALAGDILSAMDVLSVMESVHADNDFRLRGHVELVLAAIALREERPEDAVTHLDHAKAANHGWLRWEARLLLAEARAALGQLDEAVAQYDTLTGTYRLSLYDLAVSYPLRPLAHERLGSLYLQVGDTVAAARHLSEFIELWKDADPELQPRVESARLALRALTPDT
jgi:tetratricopeptide (TPR) repeat protein